MATRKNKDTVLTRKHVARLERERRQSQIIRWGAIIIAAAVVIGFLTTAFMDGVLSFGKVNIDYLVRNRPVIKVGDEVATMRDFQVNTRLQRQGLLNQYLTYAQYAQFGLDVTQQLQQIEFQLAADNSESLGQSVVDSLVNDLLVRQEAKKRGITVSEDEIQERIRAIFDYYPDGTPTPTLTPTEIVFPTLSLEQQKMITLTPTQTTTPDGTQTETETPTPTVTLTPDLTSTATATLAQSPTPTETPTSTPTETLTSTPTIIPTASATFTPSPTATPYTLQGFEDAFAQSMDSYSTRLDVSEADYRKLVESELLRQKLFDIITADVKPFEEQVWARHILVPDQVTAQRLRERILAGEDWSVIAAEFSTDTSNKDTGGDLGWFGKGAMVAEFETAAFATEPGQISEPVQTQFGWHLIQVVGHEDRPLAADAFDQLKQTFFNDWLTKARQEAEDAGLLEIFDIWKSYIPTSPNLEELQQAAQQGQ